MPTPDQLAIYTATTKNATELTRYAREIMGLSEGETVTTLSMALCDMIAKATNQTVLQKLENAQHVTNLMIATILVGSVPK
jgi:hypothetical protein